jgi:hypothetical protein
MWATRATLTRELERLRWSLRTAARTTDANRTLTTLRQNPTRLMTMCGFAPDPWQRNLILRSRGLTRTLLLCSRSSGKSTVAAALVLLAALLEAPALVLLLSRSQRQSGELFRKVVDLYRAAGRPVPLVGRDSVLKMELANGSRIICLPGNESSIRCFNGVRLLVIDEAARVGDDLYRAVRPMLAVSRGRLVALSTPFGKRGWFYDAWSGDLPWHRVRVTAEQCPRIERQFLNEERRVMGSRWYAQEYQCSFEETVGAVFSAECIEAALAGGRDAHQTLIWID